MPKQKADLPLGATFRVAIHRADGSVDNIGIIAAHYRNPLKRLWWNLFGSPRANHRINKANRRAVARRSE